MLSVVIPAYLEEHRLPQTLEILNAALADRDFEIVVVDDGSNDRTAELASEAGARVLRHPQNRGKGAAVRTGFLASLGDPVLLYDADGSSPISELDKLEAALDSKTLVVASRALDRALIHDRQPLPRDLLGRVFNFGVRLLAVPGVRDTQCGFKLYPGGLARRLAEVQRIDGFAFDVEHLLLARRWGYRIVEVPCRWDHCEESRVHPIKHSLQMGLSILGLGLRRLFGLLPQQR